MYAFGTAGLILPTLMPPFFRLKSRLPPPLNPPFLRLLDRLVDAVVDPLDPGREDPLRVPVLVLVDPDAPDVGGGGRLQGAEATATGDLEEHLRALGDHVLGDRLALVGRDKVLRVVNQDLRPGTAFRAQNL